MSDETRSHGRSQRIRRFPRLELGRRAGDLAGMIWRRPRLRVQHNPASATTKFIFTTDVLSGFKTQNVLLYQILFRQRKVKWARALMTAYSQRKDDRKPRQKTLKQFIDIILYKLFCEGLEIMMRELTSVGHLSAERLKDELDHLRAAAPRTPGRKARPRKLKKRAIRLARRYKEIGEKAIELRRFLRSEERECRKHLDIRWNEDQVRTQCERLVPCHLLLPAMRELLQDQDPNMRTLATASWTPRDLTIAMIKHEEEQRKSPLALATIEEEIRKGNKYLSKTAPGVKQDRI
jgi:hypothetical protein